MMTETKERFTANNADIGEMCARIVRFLEREGLTPRETERLRLTMEKLLRRISERLGWGTRCELSLSRRLGRSQIVLRYAGEAFDPTRIGRENEGERWSERLLTGLGLVPEWSCRRGVNRLTLRVRGRERSALLAPLAAVCLGLLLRFLLRAAPGLWTETAERLVLAPLLSVFFGAARTFVPLKLFCTVICVICGVGEATALGRMGRMPPERFLGFDALWGLLGTAALSALFRVNASADGSAAAFRSLFPPDPVSPFLRCDVGQVTLLALAVGAALLFTGTRAQCVRDWAEQCDSLLETITVCLCRLSPAAFFAAACRADAAPLLRAWKPLAAFLALGIALSLAWLLSASLRLRLAPHRLLRQLLPPLRTAFFSASCAAAFGEAMDNCENELGIGHALVLTGLPVGELLFVPAAAPGLPAAVLFLAAEHGESLSAGQVLILALAGAALAVALPSRPGTLLIGLALLAPRLSAPDAALAAAADLCFAPFAAALSALLLQAELLLQAGRLGLLSRGRRGEK